MKLAILLIAAMLLFQGTAARVLTQRPLDDEGGGDDGEHDGPGEGDDESDGGHHNNPPGINFNGTDGTNPFPPQGGNGTGDDHHPPGNGGDDHHSPGNGTGGGHDDQHPPGNGGDDQHSPGNGTDGGHDDHPPGSGGDDQHSPGNGTDGGHDDHPPGSGGDDQHTPGNSTDGGHDNHPPGSGGDDQHSPGNGTDGGHDDDHPPGNGGDDQHSPGNGTDGGHDGQHPPGNGTDGGHDDHPPGGGPPGDDTGSNGDGYEEDTSITFESVSLCSQFLAATGVQYDQSTVFCPTNAAFEGLAKQLKFGSAADLLADISQPTSENKALVTQIVKFHVLSSSAGVVTRDAIPQSAAGTGYETLLTPDSADATVTVTKAPGRRGALSVRILAGLAVTGVRKFNLKFAGPYDTAAASSYIVHAIDKPLLPPNTFPSVSAFLKANGRRYATSVTFFKAALNSDLQPTADGCTLFLPTDEAWASLGKSAPVLSWAPAYSLKAISKSAALRSSLARYHFVDSALARSGGAFVVSSSPPTAQSGLVASGVSQSIQLDTPAAGIVTGGLSSEDQATIVESYRAGPCIIYGISGYPLLPAGSV